ncbi:MAG: hypothetical protein M3547_00960 [Acidobacteriota bacterium]|nr:hypothetical protein [Acidobacteriota bacterium]
MSSDYRLFNRSPWDFEPVPGGDFKPREFPQPQRVAQAQEDPFAPPVYKPVPPPSGLEGYSRGFMGLVGRGKAAKRQAVVEENASLEQQYRDRIEAEKFRIYRQTAGRKEYQDEELDGPEGPELWFINKNDPTDRMKIGRAPSKQFAPDRSKSETEMTFEERERYLDQKERVRAKYDKPSPSPGRAPSSMELLYSYSNSPDPTKRAFAERLMTQKDPRRRAHAQAAIRAATAAAMVKNDPNDPTERPHFDPDAFEQAFEDFLPSDEVPGVVVSGGRHSAGAARSATPSRRATDEPVTPPPGGFKPGTRYRNKKTGQLIDGKDFVYRDGKWWLP